MSLKDSQFSWILGALLLAAGLTEYEIVSIAVLEQNITPYATWVFVGTLGGAYLISQREIGELSGWEIGAFGFGIGSFLAYNIMPEAQSLIASYQPHSGITLVIATMACFYILTNEDI